MMKGYCKYINTSSTHFNEIPNHWGFQKLKRVTRFIYGDSLAEEKRKNGAISVYGSNGIVGTHDVAITKEPCLIIGRKGSYGKVNYSSKRCFPIDTTYFIDENATKYNLRWLYYLLQHLKLDEFTLDDTVPGLQREYTYQILVGYPNNKDEQQKIAAFLDHKTNFIEKFIANRKNQIELLEEKKVAIINKAFTKGINPNVKLKPSGIEWIVDIPEHWEVRRLKYLSRIDTGNRNTEDQEEDGKYPFYVRADTVERISTYSFDGEAILTAGDGVGVARVFHYVNGKFDFHQRVYKICRFKKVLGKYLYYYMVDNFAKEVIKLSSKTTVDSLRLPMLANFPVVYPSKEEQQGILNFIEPVNNQINMLINKYQKQIHLITEYKTSLISNAITGKIDVRDWQSSLKEKL